MAYYPTGGQQYYLNASIGSTDTSITLSSFTEPISNAPYTMALMNTDIAYGTVAPISAQSEFISFTGITQNADGTATLTGVTRGLKRSYPYDSSSTFKIPHAGQSIFILSDAPQVFNSYAALANNNSFTGVNAFTQSPTIPDPINNTDAANKEWVLTVVNGGPVTTSQLVVTGTAGETVAAGTPVYLKAADARWWKAIGTTSATLNNVQLGIAQGTGTAGNSITGGVLIRGVDTHQSGGIAGSIGYISNTSTIATSAGTVEKAVGNFITATTFAFDPVYYYVPTADQKAAMAGNGGTPSSTNKFLTETGRPSTDVQVFNAGGTWTKPSGAKSVEVILIGAGGGGVNGDSGGTNFYGGGGGAVNTAIFNATLLSATETVTVGTGGGNGSPASNGGSSSFGTWLIAGGGGGGTASNPGGGGGTIGSASGATGGSPVVAGNAIGGQGPTGVALSSRNAEYGGATGGDANATLAGGSSIYGGGGGGGGGNTAGSSGTAGGTCGSYTSGGGGAGGTANSNGTAGSDNTVIKKGYGGAGGGGGGGASGSSTGGNGGNGGFPGGGGGGGGCSSTGVSGTGGSGANGQVTVITYF